MKTLAATIVALALTATPAHADVEVLPGVHVPDADAPAVVSYLRGQALATGQVVELDGQLVPPALDLLTWARIARCESTGRWFIPPNRRDGASGYLQAIGPSWRAYGGLEYSREAYLAPPQAQLAVARQILDAQGWRAWPVCSRLAGYR